MDGKSAFLDRFLEKEVYVEQPLRYEQDEHEDKVYKLESTLQIEVRSLRTCSLYLVPEDRLPKVPL